MMEQDFSGQNAPIIADCDNAINGTGNTRNVIFFVHDNLPANVDPVNTVMNEPASLEGVLFWRKGKSSCSSIVWWKRRYVVLNLMDGGISCFRFTSGHKNQGTPKYVPQKQFTKLHRRLSMCGVEAKEEDSNDVLALHIPPTVPWCVRDVENDHNTFVLEIETAEKDQESSTVEASEADDSCSGGGSTSTSSADFLSTESNEEIFSDVDEPDYDLDDIDEDDEDDDDIIDVDAGLRRDMASAKLRGKPLRFYFKCLKGGNEKVLWLKAFSRMDRLSSNFRKKNSLLGSLASPVARLTHSRTRSASSAAFAREGKQLETTQDLSPNIGISLNLKKVKIGTREKEHRVLPDYVYPNVWMTNTELREEMEKPSETFHDLRENACRLNLPNNPCNSPEVGTLQIEVLQGLGLPKLDRYSLTDAVVYMVSGPYAFCTDVIKNQANPMWLAKTQRACTFPLHHAYARVYIGVFDDEKNTKDDFNGRVVLDVARLRPNCTYDVTLPLRLSAHVYSRRKRGAIRLRFRLQWTSVRSALLSYLPKKVSRPRNFKPNTDTVVACGSPRAFRNVAITVHGAHLPGRFSFQQLRATLREVNFTRKTVMTIFNTAIRELREWENPLISGFVFFAWMHCCIKSNVSLVPPYIVSFFLLLLWRNYARYGMDGPAQRGFVPPSWEEMFVGLVKSDDASPAIAPLNMGYEKEPLDETQHIINYNIETHEPMGKPLFRAMGFLENDEALVDNLQYNSVGDRLEFPFADGKVYPRFSVRESLVTRKRRRNASTGLRGHSPNGRGSEKRFIVIPKMIRKDSSGMNDWDAEEQRFATGRFIRKTGATQLRGAANSLIDVGGGLTEVTGLQYVVSPIKGGLKGGLHYVVPPIKCGIKTGYQQVVPPLKSGIRTGYQQVVPPIKSGIITGYQQVMPPIRSSIKTGINGINNHVVSPLHHTVVYMRRTSNEYWPVQSNVPTSTAGVVSADAIPSVPALQYGDFIGGGDQSETQFADVGDLTIIEHESVEPRFPSRPETGVPTSGPVVVPDQDIDYEGTASNEKNNKNRKRLTDDLVEVKEKMHELTLHKFNDKAYVLMSSNSRYFGCGQKSAKRRKVEVSRDLDKLLQVGQYSHSNPVVARVGQYVEPIIGASHSFLCAFRAIFNVMTWRDPFLTFWVSLLGFLLVLVLFVFPWRLFLFVLGLWLVGPHNLALRLLRKKGVLPPKKPRSRSQTIPEDMEVPSDQVVFKGHISQDQKRKHHKPVDPQEVHHVVVPYSPFMYQRFYDWPPEEDYAQVRSDHQMAASMTGTSTSDINISTPSNAFFSSRVESKSTRSLKPETEKKNQ